MDQTTGVYCIHACVHGIDVSGIFDSIMCMNMTVTVCVCLTCNVCVCVCVFLHVC